MQHNELNERTNEVFNNVMYDFDLRPQDIMPERPEWQACKAELRRLILIAYNRNHDNDG